MDEMDRRLISALRQDARASLSDLAILLGVSRRVLSDKLELVSKGSRYPIC